MKLTYYQLKILNYANIAEFVRVKQIFTFRFEQNATFCHLPVLYVFYYPNTRLAGYFGNTLLESRTLTITINPTPISLNHRNHTIPSRV